MRYAWIYGRRLLEWLFISVVGHGILDFLATKEVFPDRFVASMITTAVDAPDWAHWLMAGGFGLLGTFILEKFWWGRQQVSLPDVPPTAPLTIGPNTSADPLHIDYLQDNLHNVVEVFPVGTIRRNIKLSVRNSGNGWLSNCRLLIDRTAPSICDNQFLLDSGFSIQGGESRYCLFLYFDEKFPSGKSSQRVRLPNYGGVSDTMLGFMKDEDTIFTLIATADDPKASAAASFMASVSDGHLTVEKL